MYYFLDDGRNAEKKNPPLMLLTAEKLWFILNMYSCLMWRQLRRTSEEYKVNTIVSASILSADLCRLGDELDRAEKCGCDHIHFDVMDGVFVNNISYGIPVLASVRKHTKMFIDAHLMITDPIRYIDAFADNGADMISFHLEAAPDPAAVISAIKAKDKKAGIAIKPATPVSDVLPYAESADMILIMTVDPGFGGQGFIYDTLDKIRELKAYLDSHSLSVHIQVDGGINDKTSASVREAGADILVAGSYLFKADDMAAAVASMR